MTITAIGATALIVCEMLALMLSGAVPQVEINPDFFRPPDTIESDVTGGLVVWDPSTNNIVDWVPDSGEPYIFEFKLPEQDVTALESPDPLTDGYGPTVTILVPPENNDSILEEAKPGWYVTYKGRPFGNRCATRDGALEEYAKAADRVLLIDPYGLMWKLEDYSTGEFDNYSSNQAPWNGLSIAWKSGNGLARASLADPANLKLLRDAIMMKYGEAHWSVDPDFCATLKDYLNRG